MENSNQKIAADFDEYQSFQTEVDRQSFWDDVEKKANQLTPDERLIAQAGVRENIEQVLQRMETIAQQLTVTEHNIAP